MNYYTGEVEEVFRKCYSSDPESPRAKVNCYGANDVTEGVAIMWKEGVDVSITGNSTNPTRFQHPVAGTYKKECVEKGKKYFSVASVSYTHLGQRVRLCGLFCDCDEEAASRAGNLPAAVRAGARQDRHTTEKDSGTEENT